MRGRPSVWRRTGRIEAAIGEAAVRRMAARMAAELGVLPAELIAEAAAFAERCQAAGARTPAEREALLAAECGVPIAEVRVELARLRDRRT